MRPSELVSQLELRRSIGPTRRQILLGSIASVASVACAPGNVRGPSALGPDGASASGAGSSSGAGSASGAEKELSEIERSVGGRVGMFALDTGTGRQLAYRADERFAMCSTFKWILAAAILARVEREQLSLQYRVNYREKDLLDYAPVTREHVAEGSMTIEALARAAITLSDNTAANLLLTQLGGPAELTQFCRSQGDSVTRLDRNEPTLNSNIAGDPRDTTSPRAMTALMQRILFGDGLSREGRERLLSWLRECETGRERLRAGLPSNWVVGDKTGSGAHGATNDVAVATPPNGRPVLIAAYLSEGLAEKPKLQAALADIGRVVARQFNS
jgi:beta-lactamase class A